MTSSQQPPARDGRAPGRPRPSAPAPVRVAGFAAAARCLGFAGVSAWQVAAGLTGPPDPRQRYAAGTVGGLLAPSAAWTAAGGVTGKAVLYVLFFLAGAPLLLGLLLAAAPALLGRWGLLPT